MSIQYSIRNLLPDETGKGCIRTISAISMTILRPWEEADAELELLYDGAKAMLLVDNVDNI